MEWTDKRSLQLISLYEKNPILWDPSHGEYKIIKKKNDVWNQIAKIMKFEVHEIRKKMESLLSLFRRQRRVSNAPGTGDNEVNYSRWFAFQAMQFLNEKFKSKTPKDIENTRSENNVELDDGNILVLLNDEERVLDDGSNIIIEKTMVGLDTPTEQNMNKRKLFVFADKKIAPKVFKKSKRTKYNKTENFEEIKQSVSTTESDACDAFGKYIANELKTFNEYNRAQIIHVFSNVLYEAHIDKFKQNIPQHQSILNRNQIGTSVTFHPFAGQQFNQQLTSQQYPSPTPSTITLQQYPSPTPSMIQQPSSQRYTTSSMTHQSVHNVINNMLTPQMKVSYSSDSSVSSNCQVYME